MADPINPAQPHDEAEELLPWYATGRLEAVQRERVEAHLAKCADCQAQLATERRLIEQFRAFSPEVESGWNRLAGKLAQERPKPIPRRTSFKDFADGIWAIFNQPAVAALATAQLAFLVLASGTLLWLSQPTCRTLGSGSAPASANVIVMFRADSTDRQVRSALGTANASIVGGPTSSGAYLVHVELRRRQLALAKLQASRDVQLAQPIDGASEQ